MLVRAIVIAGLVLTGCSSPRVGECTVTCSAEGNCPTGSICGGDEFCYQGDSLEGVILCSAQPIDGGLPGQGDANNADCSPCQLVAQCGCDSLACDVLGDPAAVDCRDVGAGIEGSGCTANTDCAAGYTCVAGECVAWCNDDDDCDEIGARCAVTINFGDPPVPFSAARICSRGCDPHMDTGCPSAQACRTGRSTVIAEPITTCTEITGSGGESSPCSRHEDCKSTFSCVVVGAESECIKNCNRTTGDGCEGVAGTCKSLLPALMIGATEYGYCL